MNESTECALTTEERTLLLELQAAAEKAAQEAIAPYDLQARGAITMIFRQRGLAGNWKLSDDKTKLLRVEG